MEIKMNYAKIIKISNHINISNSETTWCCHYGAKLVSWFVYIKKQSVLKLQLYKVLIKRTTQDNLQFITFVVNTSHKMEPEQRQQQSSKAISMSRHKNPKRKMMIEAMHYFMS
jgi:hypothetical protein